MNQQWKNIWNKKGSVSIDLDRDEFEVFCDLKKADGFDVNVRDERAYFDTFYHEWMEMYKKLNEITKRDIHSVFEVGCGSADTIDIEEKYDIVMADSVFQYFDSHEYADSVLNRMILKSNEAVYISEIHDMELKEEWLAYRRKSMENYDQIYEGLDKLFYSRDWFSDIAGKNNRQAVFTKGENPEYWNSKYVFNCFIF